VLITHNSDAAVGTARLEWIEGTGEKLRCWFAQNALVSHPKLIPLPIGIANSMWAHGNLRTLERAVAQAGRPKCKTPFVAFDTGTHPARQGVWETVRAAFPALPAPPFVPRRYSSYLEELACHEFALCPRGNGIDTHRFWESLYLDVIPIVERSTHVEYWQASGLPLLAIDDWSEVTPERLDAEGPKLRASPSARAPLRLSHYAGLVRGASSVPAKDDLSLR